MSASFSLPPEEREVMRLSPTEAALYGTPEARARDRADCWRMTKTSYGDALSAIIRRLGRDGIEIDGLKFEYLASEPTDYVTTLRHTLLFGLSGTGQTYRLMIEPVPETHR